jgi:hypothetical protein
MAVRWSALWAGRHLTPIRFLVLISVRGWVDPRAIVRPERLGELKKNLTHRDLNPRPSCLQHSALTTTLPRAPSFTPSFLNYNKLQRQQLKQWEQGYGVPVWNRTTTPQFTASFLPETSCCELASEDQFYLQCKNRKICRCEWMSKSKWTFGLPTESDTSGRSWELSDLTIEWDKNRLWFKRRIVYPINSICTQVTEDTIGISSYVLLFQHWS